MLRRQRRQVRRCVPHRLGRTARAAHAHQVGLPATWWSQRSRWAQRPCRVCEDVYLRWQHRLPERQQALRARVPCALQNAPRVLLSPRGMSIAQAFWNVHSPCCLQPPAVDHLHAAASELLAPGLQLRHVGRLRLAGAAPPALPCISRQPASREQPAERLQPGFLADFHSCNSQTCVGQQAGPPFPAFLLLPLHLSAAGGKARQLAHGATLPALRAGRQPA